MSGLTRSDEDRLKEIVQRRDTVGLDETEELELSVLEERYNRFLLEGLKKLRESSPTVPSSSGSGSFRSPRGSFTNLIKRVTSPIRGKPTAPAETDGDEIKHWSWILPRLVLGAIPSVENTSDKSAHLLGFKEECQQRRVTCGLVVSCIESDDAVALFAQPRDWEEVLGVMSFVHFPLPENPTVPIEVELTDLAFVLRQIDSTINANKVVYVHCKAGRARGWVLVMCYLIGVRKLSFSEADDLVKTRRDRVAPSETQREFVKQYATSLERATVQYPSSRTGLEERYQALLAELLSMPALYRARMVRDLEKLA